MGNVWGIIVIFKNHNLLKQDNIFTKVSFPKRDKAWACAMHAGQTITQADWAESRGSGTIYS